MKILPTIFCFLAIYLTTFSITAGTFGGTGSVDDPYLVETAEQLNNVRYYLNAHFKQVSDIDLSDYAEGKGWQPIGTWRNRFAGSYDGNGYTITNLIINRTEFSDIGLFGCTGSTARLENITLEEVHIAGEKYVGSITGYNDGNIHNTHITGTVSGNKMVGGIVGENDENAYITNSSAHATVSGEERVGGLVGDNILGSISSSYTSGIVTGHERVGGLTGFSSGSISSSYAESEVSGSRYAGGLVGRNWFGSILKSLATGIITGDRDIGGLIGSNYQGQITGSYYDTETTQQIDTGKGIPKSTEEMMQKDTFEEWDFDKTWDIIEGETYPFLRWEGPIAIFDAEPLAGTVPLAVDFRDKSSGDINTWHWNFGDSTTSEEQHPTHEYQEKGTYPVILTVTGEYGKDTATVEIRVKEKYDAEIASYEVPSLYKKRHENITLTLRNTGSNTWIKDSQVYLGAVDNQDNLASSKNWRIKLEHDVASMETHTFHISVYPHEIGLFTTEWQMLKEGEFWFGEKFSKEVEVTQRTHIGNKLWQRFQ